MEEGKCTMKTYSCGPQRERGGGGEDTEHWKHTGSKRGVFLSLQCQCFYTLTHSDPSEGGLHLVFRVNCIRPHNTHTAHRHTHTQTCTLNHHTRFYSWMKSINGCSEWAARQWTPRPGQHASPGFPGLNHKKNQTFPAAEKKRMKLLYVPEKRACWVIPTIQGSGVPICLGGLNGQLAGQIS